MKESHVNYEIAELCNVIGQRYLEIKHKPVESVINKTARACLKIYAQDLLKLLNHDSENAEQSENKSNHPYR